MTRTVLLNCPIKAEIRTVDSQSDLRILVLIRSEIILIIKLKLKLESDSREGFICFC